MLFLNLQKKIEKDLFLLLKFISQNKTINVGISQKTKEQRISQEIEAHMSNLIKTTFINNKPFFKHLKEIQRNNGSPKSPYELLLHFHFDNDLKKEIYLDLKPINILKKSSSPFMGTIHKYIKRLLTDNFYDLYFVVFYESEVNKLPIYKKTLFYFVKDITNFTLYKNWQLQISINNIQKEFGRTPFNYSENLKKLIFTLHDHTLEKAKIDCEKILHKIQFWQDQKT